MRAEPSANQGANLNLPKGRGEEDQGREALPPHRVRARRLHAQLCLGHRGGSTPKCAGFLVEEVETQFPLSY